jgi:hypothetical protein
MLLVELKLRENEKMELNVDTKSAIDLAKYPVSHGRRQHIEKKFHLLRDQVNKGKLEVKYCRTE